MGLALPLIGKRKGQGLEAKAVCELVSRFHRQITRDRYDDWGGFAFVQSESSRFEATGYVLNAASSQVCIIMTEY